MDRMLDSAASSNPAAAARILHNGLSLIRFQFKAASGCLSIEMGSKPMHLITVTKQFAVFPAWRRIR